MFCFYFLLSFLFITYENLLIRVFCVLFFRGIDFSGFSFVYVFLLGFIFCLVYFDFVCFFFLYFLLADCPFVCPLQGFFFAVF